MKENDWDRLIIRWRKNILAFVDEAIIEPYNQKRGTSFFRTTQQTNGLLEFQKLVQDKRDGKRKESLGLSVMAGRGVGKDSFTVWVMLWFMLSFPYVKVPCVSVSADQLNKVLWSEISKWLETSLIKDFFGLQNDKLFWKKLPLDVIGKRWFAFPKAANPKSSLEEQVETLAGIHEEYLLEVCDEVSGINDAVMNVMERNLTGFCNLMLLIFNPTKSKGYAIDSQYKNSAYWTTLQWNAEESEIVNKETVERLKNVYGKDSNPYRIGVLGLPPLTDESTMFPWDWIEEAIDRDITIRDSDPLIKGVDCGAGTDNSIIATRKGYKVFPFKRLKSPDSTVLSNWIGNDIDAENPDVVRVDTIGIGWAIEGALREKKGAIIESADARRTPDNPDKFYNKRAEMYWNLRDLFERGVISIPNDQDLKEQLGATRFNTDSGKIKIIEKSQIKKEIGHSPDELDALAFTTYYPDSMTSRMNRANLLYEQSYLQNNYTSKTLWMGM